MRHTRRVRGNFWRRQRVAATAPAEVGPELPSDATVNLVLDLALRIGEVQLASGAAAADVASTLMRVTAAYGLPRCEVDVTFISIYVCCHRGTAASPVMSMKVVRSRGLDYTRLSALESLVRRVIAGSVPAERASVELDEISAAKHPYPRWLATAAWAAMAASVALLLGGGPMMALVAALVTAVVDRVGRLLNRRNLPFFFQQVVGGALGAGGALVATATGLVPPSQLSLVVAAGIVVLLSGLSVVSSVQDAINGYTVTASGRTMETLLMSVGLITGVAFALRIGVRLGVGSTLAPVSPLSFGTVPIQIVTGAAAAVFFALASYGQPRALLVAGLSSALGVGAYSTLQAAGADVLTGSALAAVLIGFCGQLLSRRLRVPPLVVAISGLTPLLPGLTTYRGLYQLTVQGDVSGLSTLVLAMGIGLALAAGVVLGEFLAQPVRSRLGRLERRFWVSR
ncbi:threonine/serine exporter ThrE family protein [Kutzneria sp. NPDC052558]|uniref:threonine/serine exporter ThrE family protein n=1 Tax=Kutzneria sp. NPDC052558 TaxID=3364121 RepID=UPI0037CC2F52